MIKGAKGEMRLQITLNTTVFRGDHTDKVRIAYPYKKDELLDDFINRCMGKGVDINTMKECFEEEDFLTIRLYRKWE